MRIFPIVAIAALAAALSSATPACATVFSTLRGIVHDPQHRPIAGASIDLRSLNSAFTLNTTSSPQGDFTLPNIPIGGYRLSVEASGFASSAQTITLVSGASPILHIPLSIAAASATVTVNANLRRRRPGHRHPHHPHQPRTD